MKTKYFPVINFAVLNLATLVMWYTYVISLQPKAEEARAGGKAWTKASIFRNLSNLSEVFMIASMVLTIWYHIPEVDWPIFPSDLVAWIVAIVLAVPCVYIDVRGILDVGKETFIPEQEGKLVTSGIYRHIRHPQTWEMLLFACGAVFLNSWFMLGWSLLFLLFYVPNIKRVEEADLLRRFGDDYRRYMETTGAFFPKLSN